jgi:CBS domain-containing protein
MRTADHPSTARTADHALRVGDAMHHGVVSCPPDMAIADVARLMAEHAIHAVVVDGVRRDVSGTEHLVWGVVSDLDLVGRADGLDAEATTAGEMSATPAIVVGPEDTLAEAGRIMHDYDVHHLLVVRSADRRPEGVISTLDIAAAIAAGRV